MIRRFSDSHGSLTMSDRLVEPAELGESVGEVGPRKRRQLDCGFLDPLKEQVALEPCDDSLEEGDRLAKLAPDVVHSTELGECPGFDGAVAQCLGDGQSLTRGRQGAGVVAGVYALDRHPSRELSEPALVAERSGERLG